VGGIFVTFTVKFIEYFQPAFQARFETLAEAVRPLSDTLADFLQKPDLNALRMVVYAGVLIGLMILRPEGLFGERELFTRSRKKRPNTPAYAPPEPTVATTAAEAEETEADK